ncbi:nucleotidyltransferase domain-containing protein [Cystobacter fuscus]|uniref:nucleotidyltransferase domain-containing protein n=1 Tax=Cystobacter fuscus TaxID=43 RepID=UPI0037BEDD6B
MAKDWHETFKTWAKPPSETEEAKGSHAAEMIRKAIRGSEVLAVKNIDVYATGSYRNNTNTRLGGDIDVAVVLKDAAFYDLPQSGPTFQTLGIKEGGVVYGFAPFREDVGKALRAVFGVSNVTAGPKAFNIRENTNRMDADVAVFLEHRRYTGEKNRDGQWVFHRGVEMRPAYDSSRRIINWHQQHYERGVARNDATRRRFKRMTRILKRLRDEMKEQGSSEVKAEANAAPSFLLECLAFNATDACFNRVEGSYYEDVKAVILECWSRTRDDAQGASLVEVSGMKPLFGPGQPWTRTDANTFLARAWNYVGFKT